MNGLAQTTVSISRATGPAFSSSLFAYSVERNLLGGYAGFAVLVMWTFVFLRVGMMLPEKPWNSEGEVVEVSE